MDSNINIIPVKNAKEFMGVRIEEDSVNLFIPEALRLSNDDIKKRRDIINYLKSINIAKTFKSHKVDSNREISKGDFWPINDYLWLINDYLEYGPFYEREKKQTINDGRIDWKKTLKTIPVVSNGNIIYDKLITSKMNPVSSDITNVYMHCVKIAVKRIGWIFNKNIHINVDRVMNVTEMIYCIKKHLRETFDDLKRKRLSAMLVILNGVADNDLNSNTCTYGVTNYYYVFEKMIDSFLNGKKNITEFFPKGHWELLGESKPFESSNLRPDTIYETDDEIFVIDAKMYPFGVTKNINDLPDTTSINKQITYGDYIVANVDNEKKVRNAFIMPYDKENENYRDDDVYLYELDRNLVYIGKAYADWKIGDKSIDHQYIYTFLIDFKYLLDNYNKKDSAFIKQICNTINEKIKQK